MARKSRREKNAPQIAEQDNIIIKKKENLLATGAYGRLSVENGGNEDDETLRTQMAMLHSFIADHPDLELIDSYVDRTDDLPVVAKPWRPDMVYKILKHPVYTGNIHLGRTQQALYKSQPRRFTSLEEQTIRENTHIPLVTLEDYQSVQDAMYDNPRWAMRRNKKNLEERERLQDSLPGMVYCADCGKQMYFRRGSHDWQKGKRDGKEKVLTCYACEKRHKNSTSCGQVVYEEFLQIVAMDQVQFLIQNLADQTALLRKLSKANGGRHPLISIDRKIASLNGKIKDNGDKATKLYMSYADGIIPAEDYVTLKAQYSAVSEQLQKELCALEQRREMTEKILNKHKELADSLSGYSKSREFDARLVQQLIERISVSKNGNMEIRFKCADVVHETMKLIEGCDKE